MNSVRIASLIRSNSWLLDLVFIGLSSYFLAGSINTLVARSIRVTPSVDDVVSPTGQSGQASARQAPLVAIAERNLMGLKREQLAATQETGGPQEPSFDLSVKTFSEAELQPCTLAAQLRATILADNPLESWALIVRNDTREPQVVSLADGENKIAEDAILVAVRRREIIVRRRDHFERCTGEGDGPATAPPPTVYQASAGGDDMPQAPIPGDMTGVVRLSGTEYKVERLEVDRVLGNLNEVATQARIVPSFKNGKANGFKLFSIKPGSIYSKIGLQNGDVIQKINGYDMNSPDRALEIYTKLRDATSLTIELNRGSSTQTMNYAIN